MAAHRLQHDVVTAVPRAPRQSFAAVTQFHLRPPSRRSRALGAHAHRAAAAEALPPLEREIGCQHQAVAPSDACRGHDVDADLAEERLKGLEVAVAVDVPGREVGMQVGERRPLPVHVPAALLHPVVEVLRPACRRRRLEELPRISRLCRCRQPLRHSPQLLPAT